MSLKPIRRMCRHCRKFFFPDYRHRFTQLYCLAADCRLACKIEQQRRWLHKGKNRYYFSGQKAVQRVRDWRKCHPGYWKKRNPISQGIQAAEEHAVKPEHESCNVPTATPGTLQDFWQAQEPAFIGLLSMITGSTLQEEIVGTAHNVVIQGRNILGLTLPVPAKPNRVEKYDSQTNPPI
jgi:hypothetical protein